MEDRRLGIISLWAEEALAITRSLRVEGDLSARRLAEQIERACRATSGDLDVLDDGQRAVTQRTLHGAVGIKAAAQNGDSVRLRQCPVGE